jgi:hypothetical protein
MNKIILTLALASALFSCKKTTEQPEPSLPSALELLTNHSWLPVNIIRDGVSVWDQISSCNKDNHYTYYSDLILIQKDLGERCSGPEELQSYFKLTSDNDSLMFTNQAGDVYYTRCGIDKLDENNYSYSTEVSGIPFIYEYEAVK